jgi:hypothetical protein
MEARMLTVPRPTTRSECLEEARPCPWVGCRHHLLLELTVGRTSASMRLNVADQGTTKMGRRRGLAIADPRRDSAAALLVQRWIDDAVEALSRMEHTCVLDVAAAHPDGIPDQHIARLLGLHEQAVDRMARPALGKLHGHVESYDAIKATKHTRSNYVTGARQLPLRPWQL